MCSCDLKSASSTVVVLSIGGWTVERSTTLQVNGKLKPKLFGVLAASNIIVSVRQLFTEMTMSLDTMRPKKFNLK